jgi:hypothetical protein
MATFILTRLKVRDFSEWKRGHEAYHHKRREAGLTEKYLLRNADNSNEVFLLFEAQDLNRAKTFAESVDLRETMRKGGVQEKPEMWFLKELERDPSLPSSDMQAWCLIEKQQT